MSDFGEPGREFVIVVPLPGERLRPDSTLPKQHRYRAVDVALAARLKSFRAEHGLTQTDVASAVGAANRSFVAEWENGVNVPSGMRKRRLIELLEGKRWKMIRDAVVEGEGVPDRWQQAVRWYRRASRQITYRRTVGEVIAATLEETRVLSTFEELRNDYRKRDHGWPASPAVLLPSDSSMRLAEDAAYGLRWIEIVNGNTVDPRRSLVNKLP